MNAKGMSRDTACDRDGHSPAAHDGTEDGAATFAAFRLAVEQLLRDCPFVKLIPFVKTDGAAAYSG